MSLVYGSLFSGYGGLDLAVEAAYGARCAWQCENDKHTSKVLAARFPGVRNLGDITAMADETRLFSDSWESLGPVDIITGGFPCQDISRAGMGAGIVEGSRSGLWFRMADAIGSLRPRLVLVENVAFLRNRGLGIILSDLATYGFDAVWVSVKASDVGAPHRRERVFLAAWDAETDAPRLALAADPSSQRYGGGQDAGLVGRMGAQTEGSGRQQGPPRQEPGDRGQEDDAADPTATEWGIYTQAIQRWEGVLGRAAPTPADSRGQVSPLFVEWMMGLPAGWVTDVLERRPALKALGNGVVPQQALGAIGILDRIMGEVA